MASEKFTNFASTNLNGGINNSTTSIVVTNAAVFPAPNFRIVIDSEVMLATAVSSNTLTVTRGAESTIATSHISGASVTNVLTAGALNQIIADDCQTGLYGSLPTPEKAGRLYASTDGPYLSRDNSSSWNQFGPIWQVSPPIDSGFSWMNQGGSTTTSTNGGVYLDCPSIGSDALSGRYTATPVTPYTITIGYYPLQRADAAATATSWLYLLESSTGKMCSISYGAAPFNISGTYIPNVGEFRTWNHTSPTTFTLRNTITFAPLCPIWLRFHNDGTNITSYTGCTPYNFIQIDSQISTAPFTTAANSYGYAMDSVGNEAGMYVFHLGVT